MTVVVLLARVTITNGTITLIGVVRNGSGYSYGTLNFDSGYLRDHKYDLDAGINGLNPWVTVDWIPL